MSELTIVNFFSVVRMTLVGGFLFVLPLITRKGLLFGVYVGEAVTDSEPARWLKRRWQLAIVVVTVLFLTIGFVISGSGRLLTGSITAVSLLLLSAVPLYVWMHYQARELAPPVAAEQARVATAALDVEEPGGERLARLATWTTLLVGVALVLHATWWYPRLPDQVPTWFGFGGKDAWSPKSFGTVMVPSLMTLLLAPFFSLFGLLTSRAKRSLRGGLGGGSVQAQAAFRTATANLFSGCALCTCAVFGWFSLRFLSMAAGRVESFGWFFFILCLVMIAYTGGSLVRLLVRFGQGGSRMEHGSAEAPLTNGIADDSHWLWGVLYVNRDDPSMMVEKRFGLGYTMNFGNLKSVLLVVTAPTLILLLIAAAIHGAAG